MFALIKQCGEPKVVTKTVTEVVKVHDTITEVKIDTIYTQVFIDKVKTVKGKDSIIYVDKANDSSLIAKKYKTTVKSNEAEAKLDIVTTGELLDIKGTINYPRITETTTITKPGSGLFFYGSSSFEVGLIYNIRNKMQLGLGGQYNNITNRIEPTFTLAVRL